mmetsp:Transcript_27612/g.84092  ORF Transcript_27612/g.84092 Transcript_27612/m.84092 type:complete len:110 (+) Transcript_27612:2724-3053(+)|eukprot:scaffold52768_cov30-Tisochrysis_lutea.AAC.4
MFASPPWEARVDSFSKTAKHGEIGLDRVVTRPKVPDHAGRPIDGRLGRLKGGMAATTVEKAREPSGRTIPPAFQISEAPCAIAARLEVRVKHPTLLPQAAVRRTAECPL